MEIRAKVIEVLTSKSGVSAAGTAWKSQSIIVEFEEGHYTNKLELQNMKLADEFAQIPVGAEGLFKFNITSREVNGRWYTSCNCWRWELDQPTNAASTPNTDELPY
jgi:hypothetical protein